MNDASKNLRRALDLALAGPRNGLPHRDALSEKQKRSVLSDITNERFGEGTAASFVGRIANHSIACDRLIGKLCEAPPTTPMRAATLPVSVKPTTPPTPAAPPP